MGMLSFSGAFGFSAGSYCGDLGLLSSLAPDERLTDAMQQVVDGVGAAAYMKSHTVLEL